MLSRLFLFLPAICRVKTNKILIYVDCDCQYYIKFCFMSCFWYIFYLDIVD